MNAVLLLAAVVAVTTYHGSLARCDTHNEGEAYYNPSNTVYSTRTCFPRPKSWNRIMEKKIIWFNPQSSCNSIYVLRCYCLTSDNNTLMYVGQCLYGCFKTESTSEYYISSTNRLCSSFNHKDKLCGRCTDGHGVPAYSFSLKCVPCGNQTLWKTVPLYILVAYGPLTVFLGLIVLFTISVNSAPLRGWILVCQLLSYDLLMRVLVMGADVHNVKESHVYIQMFGSVYGVWNLDFFRSVYKPFCLHPSLSTLQVMLLDYIIAAYPLVLIAVMYIMVYLYSRNYRPVVTVGKLFRCCCIRFRHELNIRTSLVDAFGTFFSLSYIKFLTTTINLLVSTHVWNSESNKTSQRVYFDATMELLEGQHIPYAVTGILLGFLCNVLPLVLMLLYSFPRTQAMIPAPVHKLLYPFMDNILACYKDGTNGTRNCRYFGIVYHITVIVYIGCILWARTPFFLTVNASVCIVTGMLVAVIQPYKSKVYNTVDVILILSVGLCFTGTTSLYISYLDAPDERIESVVLVIIPLSIPLLYIMGYMGYRTFCKMRYAQRHYCLITRWMTFPNENTALRMCTSDNFTQS